MRTKNLLNAKRNKNDEFYTTYNVIEDELKHYDLTDKVIYCNCDDSYASNFYKYFAINKDKIKFKKLLVTGFPILNEKSHVAIVEDNIVYYRELNGDDDYLPGDFRSKECIDLLKKCDVCITNPPFSLFREYVEQLIGYEKKFLIIGNKNALTYKTIFPLIKNNQLWLGYHSVNKFLQPNGKFKTFGNIGWYTNLPVYKEKDTIVLTQHYYDEKGNPLHDVAERYPKFDNYNAINVDKVIDIPCDYDGIIGVPISFLDKYNSNQFLMLGIDKEFTIDHSRGKINGKTKYARLFIKKKTVF